MTALQDVRTGEVFYFTPGGCRYRKITPRGQRLNRYRLVEPIAPFEPVSGMFYVSDMPHETVTVIHNIEPLKG
jgi:hypothetical protein